MSNDVHEAWVSGDLTQMLAVLDSRCDLLDRHFLLQEIVRESYRLRHERTDMRELCERIGRRHLKEFPDIARRFATEHGGLPHVLTFQHLATLLMERGDYNESIQVCEEAISYGLSDFTKSGFSGRIHRIRRMQQRHAETGVKPSRRRRERQVSSEDARAACSAVPRFKQYFPSTESMDESQRSFYAQWRRAWASGTALAVDGNISYLFCYTNRLFQRALSRRFTHNGVQTRVGVARIHRRAVPLILNELEKLIAAYDETEPSFARYCRCWVSDCYVLWGDINKAIEQLQHDCMRHSSDSLLSLKVMIGQHINGRDVLTLVTPHLTKWGRDNIGLVASHWETLVGTFESSNGINVLEEWAKSAHSCPYSVFLGTIFSRKTRYCEFSYSTHEPVRTFIRGMTRQAENMARQESGLPPVRSWSEAKPIPGFKDATPLGSNPRSGAPGMTTAKNLRTHNA